MTDDASRWARVSALFDGAMVRDPAERRGYVEREAGGDADVVCEVMSLLAAHEAAGNFLEQPAAQVSADLLGGPPPHWKDGTMAGPYRILRQLGKGGMGVVYLAEDTRLGRRVALKIPDPRYVADPTRRERLRKEAQAAARLRHPNIATVFALEEVDGHLCIAAEYVPGRTLREILDERIPEPEVAVRIAVQVAGALEAAHARQIVHRDLKPDNVMVDDTGVVRLLDFGVALTLDDALDGPSRLTEPGAVIGTPGYMAPEQIEGARIDFRTDHFLFGILVFELATGVHPFRAATRAATDARILSADPPRISGPGTWPAEALDRVVRRCLRKAPGERFASTADLVSALERLLDDGPARVSTPSTVVGPASPEGTTVHPVSWWRLHQVIVSIAISLMLVGAWWLAAWIGPPYRYPLFLGLLVAGVADVTLRMNLLFVERQTPAILPRQLTRSTGWLKRIDIVFGAIYGLAALAVSEVHPAGAAFALAAAAILTIAALVIEPATTQEAHGTGTVDSRQ